MQIYICLIQVPWFLKELLGGRGVKYGQQALTAAVFIKGTQCCIIPGIVTRDLAELQIKIGERGDQNDVVVCSVYFPSDSGTPLPPKELKELVKYCAEKITTPQWVRR